MNVVVIGGGAAGMISAIFSARSGNNVTLIEKKSSLGNKLKITGKGRCNITFDGNIDDFKANIVKNYKFMYSSYSNFDNNDVVDFFSKLGVKTKVERGGRIFPVSDKAEDVVFALKRELERLKVKILYNSRVKEVIKDESSYVRQVILDNGKVIECEKCIIATGGNSYKSTGSTGDGYKIARSLGHYIINVLPGLVPLASLDNTCKALQGLTLKNVGFKLFDREEGKVLYSDFGEMLFAHFGLTGPVVLSSSSVLNRIDNIEEKLKKKSIVASIDLKPALEFETLDKRICRDFEKYSVKEFKNSLVDLLPKKLIPVVISKTNIDENKKVNQITKEERKKLVKLLKEFEIEVNGFLDADTAIVTCGGIDVKEINPKTMESKIVKGLYFAGEVIDVDAYTGGYNLQIAFSTGVAAGKN